MAKFKHVRSFGGFNFSKQTPRKKVIEANTGPDHFSNLAKQVTMGFSFSLKATYDVCKEPSSKLLSVPDQNPFCGKAPDIAPK